MSMNTPKLAAKMVLAMKAIDAVAKNGNNKFQNYKYVQAADVAHEVRKALIDNGIAFDYSVTDTDRWDRVKKDNMTEACVQVKVAVTFTDQDSGESRTVNSIGWGMDSLDKAPYKAMTGAVKYALRMNFLIPDDADPENDSQDSRPKVQPINQQLKASLAQTDSANSSHDPADDDLSFLNDDRPAAAVASDSPFSADSYRKAYEDKPAEVTTAAKVKSKDGFISAGQVKRLWAIAKQSGKSSDQVCGLVSAAGFDSIEVIHWKQYNGIIEAIQAA